MRSSDSAEDPGPAASERPFTSYSLNFEDVILNRLFRQQRSGFYVDVGAGHPRFENDLYAFYLRGWTGINVEPNEGFFALLQEMRPRDRNLCAVLSDTPGDPLTYYEAEGSGLSTCDEAQARDYQAHGRTLKTRKVPVSTLAGVLTEAGARHIDVLKVDVEGFEEKVLGGGDWERFRPSVVLVEATFPESPQRRPTNVRGFMEQRGYRHVMFDGLNDFYLEHSFPQPDGLTLPPNVFDGFVSREVADLRDQATSLRTSFDEAERYARSMEAHRAETERSLAAAQGSHEASLEAVRSLAVENRRLGRQAATLADENRRWRGAADRMRAEITVLNASLEPLHGVAEQLDAARRVHAGELGRFRDELGRQAAAMDWQAHEMRRQVEETHRLGRDLLREMGERDRHEATIRELEALRQRQDDTADEMRAQQQQQHRQRHQQEAGLRELQLRLQAVYASRSWLLTKPWRFAGRTLKRLGGR